TALSLCDELLPPVSGPGSPVSREAVAPHDRDGTALSRVDPRHLRRTRAAAGYEPVPARANTHRSRHGATRRGKPVHLGAGAAPRAWHRLARSGAAVPRQDRAISGAGVRTDGIGAVDPRGTALHPTGFPG